MRLLAIDIGNSNIGMGIFQSRYLIKRVSIPTKQKNYKKIIKKIFTRYKIDDTIICSVVPEACRVLAQDIKVLSGKRPRLIGRGIKVPIKNLYHNPGEVGSDRLVNAYAGTLLYGSPLIIIDFGTAVTLDVISKKREYLGGMILPGLDISLDALTDRTALLPKVKLEKPRSFIGRDTKSSILSGILFGFGASINYLSDRTKGIIGKNAKVIGTGGKVNFIKKYCNRFNRIDNDLTLKGLYYIYQVNYESEVKK
ncbi:MAG: type III pantothenate kinase [Candidatus Omnitrophica bacterium]|nr:type III pantothenate kinase [Candidatus Omnitrophota bacterium]MBU1905408.1 type III pantothenate kinase [Candidatus Omnitrophota bacterium]